MRRARTATSGGQAAPEYVGLLLLVALGAAGGALAAASHAPALASALTSGMRQALCTVTGGICSLREARAARAAPCVVLAGSDEEELMTQVAVIRLRRRDLLAIEKRSDGSAAVSFVDGGRAAGRLGVGAAFTPLRLRATAGVEAGLAFGAGSGWEFGTWAAADAFARRWAARERLAGEAGEAARRVCPLCPPAGSRPRRAPPPPAVRWTEAGPEAEAEVRLSLGLRDGGLDAKWQGATVLGRRTDAGGTTWAVRADGEAAGALGAALALEGRRARSALLEYRVDRRGEPVRLRVTVAAGDAQGARATIRGASGRALAGRWRELSGGLDLRDSANRAVVVALARALVPGAPPGALSARARELGRRIAEVGTVDGRAWETWEARTELGAELAAGPGLGLAYERTRRNRRLVDAWTQVAGGARRERGDCAEASRAAA